MKPILQGEINLELRDALRTYLRGSRGGMTSQSNVKQSFIRTKLTNKSLVPTFLIVYAARRDSAGSIAHNVGVDGADWQLCRFMHMKNVVYRHGTLSRIVVCIGWSNSMVYLWKYIKRGSIIEWNDYYAYDIPYVISLIIVSGIVTIYFIVCD